MNGLYLYREIKKVDDRVKACFLTALSDLQEYEDFKKEVFPKGERYPVVKPIDNEEMLKRVNEMITVND
jgi:DNA-binding response OmpR family regulator